LDFIEVYIHQMNKLPPALLFVTEVYCLEILRKVASTS
jgi:hypothetical protein